MTRSINSVFAGLIFVSALALPSSVLAQRDPFEGAASFRFEKTDVSLAIKSLFEAIHVPCSLERGISGTVSCSAVSVPFETGALQRILRQNCLTYRAGGGVFQVVKMTPDRSFSVKGMTDSRGWSVESNYADVRLVLRQLFKKARIPYSIDRNVTGCLPIDAKGSFEEILRAVLQSVNATFEIRDGKYHVFNAVSLPANDPRIEIRLDSPRHIAFLRADNADVQSLLFQIFMTEKTPFVFAWLEGRVSINLKDVSFDSALHTILEQVHGRCISYQGVRLVQLID